MRECTDTCACTHRHACTTRADRCQHTRTHMPPQVSAPRMVLDSFIRRHFPLSLGRDTDTSTIDLGGLEAQVRCAVLCALCCAVCTVLFYLPAGLLWQQAAFALSGGGCSWCAAAQAAVLSCSRTPHGAQRFMISFGGCRTAKRTAMQNSGPLAKEPFNLIPGPFCHLAGLPFPPLSNPPTHPPGRCGTSSRPGAACRRQSRWWQRAQQGWRRSGTRPGCAEARR